MAMIIYNPGVLKFLIKQNHFELTQRESYLGNFLTKGLRTNQLEVNTDERTLRPIARLKEPRELFALPKDKEHGCSQQAPRWPIECQRIFNITLFHVTEGTKFKGSPSYYASTASRDILSAAKEIILLRDETKIKLSVIMLYDDEESYARAEVRQIFYGNEILMTITQSSQFVKCVMKFTYEHMPSIYGWEVSIFAFITQRISVTSKNPRYICILIRMNTLRSCVGFQSNYNNKPPY
ncbi:hypothetical protein GQX74_007949 [Glossina fuscipes]|nr:hypothetical protein GQX74_007949 [Glossina fuscipes]